MRTYDVIIVGGGPTGVALGIELGLNNIKTLVLEKHPAPLLSPRAQSLNARSMEFFMRWHLVNDLKAKQLLPPDYPIRGIWCSGLTGKVYSVSSSNEQLNDQLSPQLGIRIPLWITEEVLRSRLSHFACVTFLKNQAVIDVQLEPNHVLVTAENKAKQPQVFQTSYVVACDGANSLTRQKMQLPFKSLAPSHRVINVMFRSLDLEKKITMDKGFLYYLLERANPGAMGPVDLTQGLWYAQIRDNSSAVTIQDIDLDHVLEEMAGTTFKKEIVQAHFWDMHIQMAEHYAKDNRVFLVGDSAHAFVPTGGFGLNTGLGDVINLGWKLAAVIKDKANPLILETYEQERLPICLHNLKIAQKNADGMMLLRKKHDPNEDPAGFAQANAALAQHHTHSAGTTMGYAYFGSPLTQLQKGQSTQPMEHSVYHPTAAPGYFLPHCRIGNQSIYEILSPTNWTLITSDEKNSAAIRHWQEKLKKYPISLEILSLEKNRYPFKYILIRPDWHIAFAEDQLGNGYCENFNILFRGC